MKKTALVMDTFLKIFILFFFINGFFTITVSQGLSQPGGGGWDPAAKATVDQNFEGKVIGVSQEKKEITIDYNGKKIDFKCTESSCTSQQESLLKNVKSGDTIMGKRINNNTYHLDKKGP